MKAETIHTLSTAKVLFEKAQELCLIDDKFIASAGLVILQDSLELVFYAVLFELGVDEKKSIENLSFDQLIGELKNQGLNVLKSGRLKALNKERVIVKHYGQLAEPESVKGYFETAKLAIDDLLMQSVKRTLQEIMLHEVLKDSDIKKHLELASTVLENDDFFDALVEVRKAIYIGILEQYSVEGWSNNSRNSQTKLSEILGYGGFKAPLYTKNREWIDENVNEPFDYIQLDHEKLRLDLIEWGVNTQDFWNLWRLTPEVIRHKKTGKWLIKREIKYLKEAATRENAQYCIERAIALFLKMQNHFDLTRSLIQHEENQFIVKLKTDQTVFEKAASNSKVVGTLAKETVCLGTSVVDGFGGEQSFIKILYVEDEPKTHIIGYIPSGSGDIF